MDYVNLAMGIALLLFGRNLFWLVVGLAGFLLGVQLVPLLFPDLAPWLVLIAGSAAGLAGALLAILAERVALGLAGFFVGALLGVKAVAALGLAGAEWAGALGVGLAGAVVTILLTDWAIIVLSSLAGASVVVDAGGLSGTVGLALFAALFVVGVAVQRWFMLSIGHASPGRRRSRQ